MEWKSDRLTWPHRLDRLLIPDYQVLSSPLHLWSRLAWPVCLEARCYTQHWHLCRYLYCRKNTTSFDALRVLVLTHMSHILSLFLLTWHDLPAYRAILPCTRSVVAVHKMTKNSFLICILFPDRFLFCTVTNSLDIFHYDSWILRCNLLWGAVQNVMNSIFLKSAIFLKYFFADSGIVTSELAFYYVIRCNNSLSFW